MSDLHKAAQQALEALEGFAYHGKAAGWPETITTLRAALAEPVEPVPQPGVWMHPWPPVKAQQAEPRGGGNLPPPLQAEPDLSRCPQCNGPADNGHDRSIPPHPYLCTKCMAEMPQPSYNVTVVDDAHPNGIPLEQWQNKPVAWRCACGANLYIDAQGRPASKAEPAQEPQTLDAAMQQPRAMAQAYENGYKAGAAAEREACAKLAEATICDTHLPTGVRIYGTRVADAIRARGSA